MHKDGIFIKKDTSYINLDTNPGIMQHQVTTQTNIMYNDRRCHSF